MQHRSQTNTLLSGPDLQIPPLKGKVGEKVGQVGAKVAAYSDKLAMIGLDPTNLKASGIKTDSIGGFMSSMQAFTRDSMFDAVNGLAGGLLSAIEGPLKDFLNVVNPVFWAGRIFGAKEQEDTLKTLVELLPLQTEPMTLYILSRRENPDFNKYLSEYNGWIKSGQEHEDIIKDYRNIQKDMFDKIKKSLEEAQWMGLTYADAQVFENWVWSNFFKRQKITWWSGGWKNILNDMYYNVIYDYIAGHNKVTTTLQMLSYYVPAVKDGYEPISGLNVYREKDGVCSVIKDKIYTLPDLFADYSYFVTGGTCIKARDLLLRDYNIKNEADYINFLANPPKRVNPPATNSSENTSLILKMVAIIGSGFIGAKL